MITLISGFAATASACQLLVDSQLAPARIVQSVVLLSGRTAAGTKARVAHQGMQLLQARAIRRVRVVADRHADSLFPDDVVDITKPGRRDHRQSHRPVLPDLRRRPAGS